MIAKLEAIKHLFLHEWDPLGVSAVPEASDEYDAYAMRVFTSLHSGATEHSIAEYLDWLETVHMGLSIKSDRSAQIARKVLELHSATAGNAGGNE
ncbi:MAG: hypothetical protein LH466_06770 [Sphingomonas bacterium]|nr:hypothetical protein [Sphingomonas bacterium]